MSHYYPEDEDVPYYVEFERGGHKGQFTLFKRNGMYSEEQLAAMEKENPKDIAMLRMCNEFHPWNILTATYGPPGCMPDEPWIHFMVDALNREAKREQAKVNYDAAMTAAAKLLAEDIDKEIFDKLIVESKKTS